MISTREGICRKVKQVRAKRQIATDSLGIPAECHRYFRVNSVALACVPGGIIGLLYLATQTTSIWLMPILALASLAVISLFPSANLRLRAVDWWALVVFVFEIPSLVYSQNRANSIRTSEVIILSVLVYFLVRIRIRELSETAVFAGLIGVGGACLAYFGLREFMIGVARWTSVGFNDFVAFRSRFMHPIGGWVPGECFTFFLLSLPFACAPAAYYWIEEKEYHAALAILPALSIAGLLCLSLSRAVFWSTVLFVMSACGLMILYRVVAVRVGAFLLAGALGALVGILVVENTLYPTTMSAYSGSHTSQARSTRGRLDIWNRSLELLRDHRWWGVGSSNAALWLLSSADQEETTGFAGRTFSLPIQILAEKGIIGLVLYSVFLLLIGLEFHRTMRSAPSSSNEANAAPASRKQKNMRRSDSEQRLRLQRELANKAMKCCFAGGLAAVLFRELTYSSLFEHTLTLALAFTLTALMCVR